MKREHLWTQHERHANSFWELAEGGYPTPQSVRAGEEVRFHVSNSRAFYDIQIYREDARRELVHTIPNLRGELQSIPDTGYRDGFDWRAISSFTVPRDWKSGVYIAAFPTAQGPREILFVVRPSTPRAPILLTIATNTYCAYNNVGGKCFYDYISTDRQLSQLLSFERPLQPDTLGNFHIWDQFFVSWLDAEGYDVDYCVNADHEAEPELLNAYTANLRVGHDEYNTGAECEQLQCFVQGGGNLLLFTGNAFYHEVELRNATRQIFCAKDSAQPDATLWSTKNNLRQQTIGVSYTSFVNAKTDKPNEYFASTQGEFGFYRVVNDEHWIYEGTGLKNGEEFGREDSIVGVEADAGEIVWRDGVPEYSGCDGVSTHYKILALADTGSGAFLSNQNTCYREPRGEGIQCADAYGTIAINETEFAGTIFNAATIEWCHGLHNESSPVAQITRNVLHRLAK